MQHNLTVKMQLGYMIIRVYRRHRWWQRDYTNVCFVSQWTVTFWWCFLSTLLCFYQFCVLHQSILCISLMVNCICTICFASHQVCS